MTARDIAYRISCLPPAVIGGTIAQHIALLIACRWAQEDGRFAVLQSTIASAAEISTDSVTRAMRALRACRVVEDLGSGEARLRTDHLPTWSLTAANRPLTAANCRAGTEEATPPTAANRPLTAASPTSETDSPPISRSRSQRSIGRSQRIGSRSGPEAVSVQTDVSVSSSPFESSREEGEDARAGEAGAAAASASIAEPADAVADFTEREQRQLAWLAGKGALLTNPATGEDLRAEWLRATASLGAELVGSIMLARVGDYPSDFRKAQAPFEVQIAAHRAAVAKRAAAELAAANPPETPEQAEASLRRQREADDERKRVLRAAEEARERGPFLEQAQALLAEIDSAEPRRLALADDAAVNFTAGLRRLRAGVAEGRVASLNLVCVRGGWPYVRDRPLPALEPEPTRATGEPAAIDQEHAQP